MHAHPDPTLPGRGTRGSIALDLLTRAAANLVYGELTVLRPDGQRQTFRGSRPGPSATLEVRDASGLRRVLARGDTGFAEAYIDGDVDSPDLEALLELGALNERHLSRVLAEKRWFRLAQRAFHLLRANTRRGSRRNIAEHYDLGNEFYRCWLDPSMSYSCALFEHPTQSLADAQRRKHRRIADLLAPGCDDHVLEIGCGWGGFALDLAEHTGCRVTGVTLSSEQLRFARERAIERGLADRVTFRLEDYRDVRGRYDHVASVEMFEAVGEPYWPTFFRSVRERLVPGGRAVLQVITIDEETFPSYRRGCDFIQRYVFPGGMLPPARLFARGASDAGLATVRQDFFGAQYARTLERWRERFSNARVDVRGLGFDERFQRLWRYYLAYCRAGFVTGRVDLMQTLLAAPRT